MKKDNFWFTKNGLGFYFHRYYYPDGKNYKTEIEYCRASSLDEVISQLTSIQREIYARPLRITFDKKSIVKTEESEKRIISDVIHRLERDAKNINQLEKIIKKVNSLSSLKK